MAAIIDKKTLNHVWPIRNKRFLVLCDAQALALESHEGLIPIGTIRRIVGSKGKAILAPSFGTYAGHPISLSALHRVDALAKFPAELSSKSLVNTLKQHFTDADITFVPDSMNATEAVNRSPPGGIVVLENLRFYANELSPKAESRRDMARVLASYCDVVVNDNFDSIHQESASATELPRLLRHAACGQLLEHEINYFQKFLTGAVLPQPTCLIIGSNRVEEKLKSLEHLLPKVDKVLFGTAIAIPFLKAKGINVGRVEDPVANAWSDRSISIEGFVQRLLNIAARHRVRLVFPVDFVCGNTLEISRHPHNTQTANVPADLMALDLGLNTQALYATELRDARTIFWNGHLGAVDTNVDFGRSTVAIAKSTCVLNADVVICGRSTLASLRATNVDSSTSHITSSSLTAIRILQGSALPGLEVISDAQPAVSAGTEKVQELLRHTSLFGECTPRELQALASRAALRSLAAGDVLVREGDRITSVFIVSNGQLSAWKRGSSKQRSGEASRMISRGQTIGELDFLHGRSSVEDIRAASNDVALFQITASSVDEVLAENPEMTSRLVKSMIDKVRLIEENERVASHSTWAAIEHDCTVMRKPIPTPAFSKTFTGRGVHALSSLVSAAVLHSLTLQLQPYALQAGTCNVAKYGSGLGMVLLHHFARDISFSNLVRSHAAGPTLGAVLSQAALAPLRLASQGIPFGSMSSGQVIDAALTDGAMALAPRVAHSLFRFSETPSDRTSKSTEVLLTCVCRAVTAVIFFPIICRRNGNVLVAKNLLVYVMKQLLSAIIELLVHRYLQGVGKFLAW